jgi:hypothetical protein
MWKVGILAALTLTVGAFLQGCFPFPPFISDPTDCDTLPLVGPPAMPVPYRTASGSIHITGSLPASINLTTLGTSGPPAAFDPSCFGGAAAEFTDATGLWSVDVITYPASSGVSGIGGPGSPGEIAVIRRDVNPPFFVDASTCTTAFTEVSAAGLVGHAECHGLHWSVSPGVEPNPNATQLLPSFAPFDLTVRFEARP